MQVDMHGGFIGKDLRLSTQTNKGNTLNQAVRHARLWGKRHKSVKSFTINAFQHTDYHGKPVIEETGYSTFDVSYYTTKNEGCIPI